MNSSNMILSFDTSSSRAIHSCVSTDSSTSSDSTLLPLPALASDPRVVVYPEGAETYANTDVQLEVSGNSFVLNISDFQQLAALPWKPIHSDSSAFRLDGVSHEAFQKCIDYVIFEVLPTKAEKRKMSEQEKQEVRSLASTANLTGLLDHMTSSSTKRRVKQQNATKTSVPRRKKFLGGWFSSSATKSHDVESKSKPLSTH